MFFINYVYDNFWKTKSKVKSNKPKERHYTFDDGFTGDRKTDMNSSSSSSVTSKSKKVDNDSRDER